MDNSSVCIIVPIFNEEQVVRKIVQSLVADKFTTVIVDDGSSDNSFQSISDLPVKILKHSTNFGQAAEVN